MLKVDITDKVRPYIEAGLERIRFRIAEAPEGDYCNSESQGKCPEYRPELDCCRVLGYKVNGRKHCLPEAAREKIAREAGDVG